MYSGNNVYNRQDGRCQIEQTLLGSGSVLFQRLEDDRQR
ncbi:unnamed protein product [Fusarium venenatum]|uniref:Uncharacterized protein n=1 Tax=Fusarium venenatum TaxID=56646 RepID=A0A2L2ST81_9HYPO|nr:uncharacterized protein FVRRES_04900 [Fusarium venenatum]CEI60464.1 unnamed protein product [Fusarium venenatum]